MEAQEEQLLRQQLGELRNKHRELDEKLAQIELSAAHDQITLTRLKKQKLQIKDLIIQLEDRLFPDIIA